VDPKTRDAYNARAAAFAAEYESQAPQRLYDLALKFFRPAGLCLDVGCGSGRDLAWLASAGFKTLGIDASERLLKQAAALHPGLEFREESLPDLETLQDSSVENVFCSGVLMHLPDDDILSSCSHLLRVLKDSGTLLLSFRASRNPDDAREDDGRLYTPLEPVRLVLLFETLGAKVLHREESLDSRGLRWQTLVLRKGGVVTPQ